MRLLRRFVIILTSLVLFASCSDSFLGTGTDKSFSEIRIKSLRPWGTLKNNQSVTFSIVSPGGGDVPDNLEIYLYNSAGENIMKLENATFSLNSDLSLNPFTSIPTGQYKLEFRVFSGTTLLTTKDIIFFYTNSDFIVKGIESFPSGIYPGAHVLLKSSLQIPAQADPFLRWTMNDKVIAKGKYSDGKSKIIWTAPEDEGVYTIRLELFPVQPLGTDDFASDSDTYMDVELFVSNLQTPSKLKLLPDSSYYSLFHFDGNLTDSGFGIKQAQSKNQDKLKALLVGSPELVTKDDDFGYTMSRTAGFIVPYCIFPVDKGYLSPFTLTLGLDLEKDQNDKTLFKYVSDDNSFNISIVTDGVSNLSALLTFNGQVISLPSEINLSTVEKRFILSLSLIPSLTDMTAIWYLDGIRMNKTVALMNGDGAIGEKGTLTIGGDLGAEGVIYELGTFYKDAKGRTTVDPSLYKSAMEQKYQSAFVYAEGFESLYIPESVKITGRAWMEADALSFESGIEIALSKLQKNNVAISVSLDFISFTDELGIVEFFWDKAEEPFLRVGQNGKIITGEKENPKALPNASGSIRFKIHDGLSLVTFTGDKTLKNLPITRPTDRPEQLTIKITNTDPKKPVTIDTVTVFTEKK